MFKDSVKLVGDKQEMISYVKGNIFESPAQVITNTVNTVGVMGKGIALEYKKRYPKMFEEYKKLCKAGTFKPGNLALWKDEDKWILLFPTKEDWRKPSKLEYIENGLKKFLKNWDKYNIDSIAFPKLGCGNGGLNWNEVKPLMEKYLRKLPINIYIYVDNYEEQNDSENLTDVEKWLSGTTDLNGYDLFKKELIYKIQTDNQLQKKYNTRVDDTYLIMDGEIVDEQVMLDNWNMIKSSGIILIDEAETHLHMSSLLEVMKHMNKTKMIYVAKDDNKFSIKPNAYQYVSRG